MCSNEERASRTREKYAVKNIVSYNIKMLMRSFVKRGPFFRHALSKAIEFRRLDGTMQRLSQIEMLRDTLALAEGAKQYADRGDDAAHFSHPVDYLKTFPYVEKEDVRRHPFNFVTSRYPRFKAHTSGTTGTPLHLWRDLFSIAREEAGFFLWYRDGGWSPEDRMAELRGDMIIPVTQNGPPYSVRDFVFNRVVLSTYHLSDANLPQYLDVLTHNNIKYINAYPSAAYILADYIRRMKLPPLGMQAVFLASESAPEQFTSLIHKYIGKVHRHYGNGERTVWMTSCKAGRYHEDVQYGFTEYVPCGEEMYEIVSTNFTNAAMPLIRYRTGDIATGIFGWNECPCGKSTPGCTDIIGRKDDCIVTRDGRRIGRLDHIFKKLENIIAAQILQKTETECEIRVVRDSSYTKADELKLLTAFKERTGEMQVTITYCEELPRGARGKFRAVVSHLDKKLKAQELDG